MKHKTFKIQIFSDFHINNEMTEFWNIKNVCIQVNFSSWLEHLKFFWSWEKTLILHYLLLKTLLNLEREKNNYKNAKTIPDSSRLQFYDFGKVPDMRKYNKCQWTIFEQIKMSTFARLFGFCSTLNLFLLYVLVNFWTFCPYP
jgi:hypothetical protein